jgi:D-sedoheptulose 7-phosphate isomerase
VTRALRESARLHARVVEECAGPIVEAASAIEKCLRAGGKILLFGNGGSAADAQHIAAEFVGRFARERAPLPALALTTDTSALTAIGNDYGFEQVFARQVRALGRPGDVAVAISTSGRSPNVLAGVGAARERGMTVIGLAGRGGGALAEAADICITVPSDDTARIQECHLTIEHAMCEAVERLLFGG